MRNINTSLKYLLLREENTGDLEYQLNIGGETFQVALSIDKGGVRLDLTPTNPEGDMILNLSEEEVATLKNSLMNTLQPKFSRYKMEISAEDLKGVDKTISLNIPVGSFFPFIKNIIQR